MANDLQFKVGLTDTGVSKWFERLNSQSSKAAKAFMADVEAMNSKVGKFFAAAGGSAVAMGLANGLGQITAYSDRVIDLSSGLGMSAESFQRLAAVFQQGGTEGEKFASGMQKMNSQIDAAKDGNKAAIENFKRLGITLAQLNVLDSETILMRIADGLKRNEGDARTTAAAFELLGKGQTRMIGSLRQGSEEIESQMAKVTVASQQALNAIDAFGDGVTNTKNQMLALGAEGFGGVLRWTADAAEGLGQYKGLLEELLPSQNKFLLHVQRLQEMESKAPARLTFGDMEGIGRTTQLLGAGGMVKQLSQGAIKADPNAAKMAEAQERMSERWRQFQIDNLEGEAKIVAMRAESDRIAAKLLNARDAERAALTEQLGLLDLQIAKEKRLLETREKMSRLTRMQEHLGTLRNERSRLLDEQLEDELASPDERREKRRFQRREDRARARIARNNEARERDERTRTTRPGSNRQAEDIRINEGQISELIEAIKGLIAR